MGIDMEMEIEKEAEEEGQLSWWRRGATLELISRCHTKVKCHLTNVDMLICMQNSEGGTRSCWAEEEEEVMKGKAQIIRSTLCNLS